MSNDKDRTECNVEENIAKLEERYTARIEALGITPGEFLPENDSRAMEARQALDDYRSKRHKLIQKLDTGTEPTSASDLVQGLLQDCQVERAAAFMLQHCAPQQVDWPAVTSRLWRQMDAICLELGGTRPEQPRVANVDQLFEAINTVVSWCGGVSEEHHVLARQSSTSPQRDPLMEARDKWIYDQCMEGVVYMTIVSRLGRIAGEKCWAKITSAQGIKKAAKTYAKRHNMPLLPPRKGGRPKREM